MTMTRSDIEYIANRVLIKYVSKGGAYKQFENILKGENIKYREIEADKMKFAGVFTKAPNGQKYIMINSNMYNDGRKNFTLAHELGHYFLNHELKHTEFDKQVNEECLNKEPMQYEADYFATCLLMPEEKVIKAVKSILYRLTKGRYSTPFCITESNYQVWATICKDLTKRYGVSESALRYRLKKLDLINFDFL